MIDAVKKINQMLDSIGGTAEGHFKVFKTNNDGASRTHLFLKADKLPLQPAVDLSFDLPGDSDDLVVSGANAIMDATGLGNEPEPQPAT